MARRMSWDEPSLTLTTSPQQNKQSDVILMKLDHLLQENMQESNHFQIHLTLLVQLTIFINK